ncbi:hypothetical protein PVAND_003183 [Polypedilum vanderplanki]|uniref:GB1/RHD3-type G domain-containing protein n=1 Tax=Polypedilum vanderplanki TaxID=319348 RepID=A0A9J6BU74_POLVA|nr:hypothetical protein PVAND_003183 [Polypedilum vanderplanki]
MFGELEALLLHPEVVNRKIVLLSIVGAFRRGKSFFLDYCLRFLYANYASIKNPSNLINADNWIGAAETPLEGFTWRSGTQRDTTGIIFWSDVFLTGDRAILIVDSQGLFDNETSTADNSKIFSLVTLMTSIEILNLQGLIQEDHLQYLQFATEYGKFMTSPGQEHKPFQNFVFLLRDWNNPDEYPFGFDGGQKYLENTLVVKPHHPEELKSVRTYLKSSFEKLSCCLLPYPGKTVARDSNYDGRWASMDEEFLDELKILISSLLKSENLTTKKINGIEVNGKQANEYFQQYITIFQSNSSIQPQSIYETTIDKFLTALVLQCFQIYKNHVNQTVGNINNETEITNVLHSSRNAALSTYDGERKMGNAEHIQKYRNDLDAKMNNDSIEWIAIAMARIAKIREEQRRAAEAAREAERLRLEKENQERLARERAEQAAREQAEREAEAARQAEILRQQQAAIAAEQERQRLAEEQRQREIAEQQRIEAERAAEEARRQQQQHHGRRRKKCSVM